MVVGAGGASCLLQITNKIGGKTRRRVLEDSPQKTGFTIRCIKFQYPAFGNKAIPPF